ncbi:MAG: DUF4347 domain-containing protein, partial [Burkholderiaceae bacterium]
MATGSSRARRSPLISALEPRLLLDGAAVATVARSITDAGAQPEGPEPAATSVPAAPDAASTAVAQAPNPPDIEPAPGEHTLQPDAPLDSHLPVPTSEDPTGQVIVVDDSVPFADELVADISPDWTVIRLQGDRDGLTQLAEALSAHQDLKAIHLFTHGGEGRLQIGATSLTEASLEAHAGVLRDIGSRLSPTGDLLIYGCDVAQGFVGQAFVNALARATGADVAASDDATGSAVAGGDWQLEAATGPIDAGSLQASIGDNTLTSHSISIGQNSPRLYWQGRAESSARYAQPFTQDKQTAYYRNVWRSFTYTVPKWFLRTENRTGWYQTTETAYWNYGSGTRYGTVQFTLPTSSFNMALQTTGLSRDSRGTVETAPYSVVNFALYRGSFNPGDPMANLVMGNRQSMSTSLSMTAAYGRLEAGTYIGVVSFDNFNLWDNNNGWWAGLNYNAEQMWGSFNLTVTNLNQAPVWGTVTNPTVSGSGVRSFSVPWSSVYDPDGDALSITAALQNGQPLPSWLSYNANSLTFTGNPAANTAPLAIRLTAADGQTSSTKDFTVSFTSDNDAPVVAATIPDQTWSGSGSFSYQVNAGTFTDSDLSGTSFTYSATLADGSALPAWLAFNTATRTFSGNPPANASDLSLRVTANDGSGQANATVFSDFALRLRNNNDIPVATGFAKSFAEDGVLSFTGADFALADTDTHAVGGTATTGTGKTLANVRILTLPAAGTLWLDADTNGRQDVGESVQINQEIVSGDLLKLRYTPAANWSGSTSFTWNATDGIAYATSAATVSITVSLVNDPPTLALSGGRALSLRPNTGNALSAITVDPGLTLTDPDTPYTADAANYDTILGATVTVVDSVTGNVQSGDVLAGTGISGRISVSYDGGSGALTLSGSATAAEYQQVLRTLAFSSTNTSNDNLRTISIALRTKDVTIPTVANFDGVDDYIETMR